MRTRSAQSQRGEERRGVVTGLDGEPALTGLTELVAAWAGLGGQAEKLPRFRQPASVRRSHTALTLQMVFYRLSLHYWF